MSPTDKATPTVAADHNTSNDADTNSTANTDAILSKHLDLVSKQYFCKSLPANQTLETETQTVFGLFFLFVRYAIAVYTKMNMTNVRVWNHDSINILFSAVIWAVNNGAWITTIANSTNGVRTKKRPAT